MTGALLILQYRLVDPVLALILHTQSFITVLKVVWTYWFWWIMCFLVWIELAGLVVFWTQILIWLWVLIRLRLLSEIQNILRFKVILRSFWLVQNLKLSFSHVNMVDGSHCLKRQFKLRVFVWFVWDILIRRWIAIFEAFEILTWLIFVGIGFFFESWGKTESFSWFFILEGVRKIVNGVVSFIWLLTFVIYVPCCASSYLTWKCHWFVGLRKD